MNQDKFAHGFFLVSLAIFSIAGGLAYVLIHLSRSSVTDTAALALPPAFWLSTLLLIAGRAALHRSLHLVRVEKQRPFRRFLLIAMAAETLFVSVQSYGLWCLLQNQRTSSEAARFANLIQISQDVRACASQKSVSPNVKKANEFQR